MHPLIVFALLQAPLAAPKQPTVCYEVFVRSFYDSNGDGIGDLRGLTQKLDYISGLGADCVWLMPVAESPSYHGYDVTDYYKVEPDYGTNDDFKAFVAAAHQRHIRVLVDMVLNHTSSEHPWFQEALRDTAAPHRAWYRWSQTAPPPPPGNNWHHSPVRDEYYFGLFWSGMPDLNYETPAVLDEMKRVAPYWLKDMGVDGFRLDAVRQLVEQGVPFVYYGEEIGMTGDKPDERLRTPMQWARSPAAGFTRGKPWEALQADSFTANVAVESRDTASLLNLYRRLMKMRATKSALRNGELVPVETGNESLLAYVRRNRTHAVLVVANLGNAPVVGVPIPKGYRLFGQAAPVALDPRRAYIFDLVRSP